jgi:hypothetical protein
MDECVEAVPRLRGILRKNGGALKHQKRIVAEGHARDFIVSHVLDAKGKCISS